MQELLNRVWDGIDFCKKMIIILKNKYSNLSKKKILSKNTMLSKTLDDSNHFVFQNNKHLAVESIKILNDINYRY